MLINLHKSEWLGFRLLAVLLSISEQKVVVFLLNRCPCVAKTTPEDVLFSFIQFDDINKINNNKTDHKFCSILCCRWPMWYLSDDDLSMMIGFNLFLFFSFLILSWPIHLVGKKRIFISSFRLFFFNPPSSK